MKSQQFHIVHGLALVMGFTVAFVAGSKPLAAQPPEKTKGEIYGSLSDKCLQPAGGSTAAGAAIVTAICDRSPAQTWKSVAVKGGYVHYVNQLSGMCLDARGGAKDGTPVQQWPCNQITNENWEYATTTPAIFSPRVFSRVSGTRAFCLDLTNGVTAAGATLQIYGCYPGATQRWFTP